MGQPLEDRTFPEHAKPCQFGRPLENRICFSITAILVAGIEFAVVELARKIRNFIDSPKKVTFPAPVFF